MENNFRWTFAMLKPDVFENGHVGSLITHIEHAGWEVMGARVRRFSTRDAEWFYAEHEGKPHFPRLVEFMKSGRVMGLVLRNKENVDGIQVMRTMIGAANPHDAEKGTLRAMFGEELPRNAIHASDSQDAFFREVNWFFGCCEDSAHKIIAYFREGPRYG